jgi:hypothetical protein
MNVAVALILAACIACGHLFAGCTIRCNISTPLAWNSSTSFIDGSTSVMKPAVVRAGVLLLLCFAG